MLQECKYFCKDMALHAYATRRIVSQKSYKKATISNAERVVARYMDNGYADFATGKCMMFSLIG